MTILRGKEKVCQTDIAMQDVGSLDSIKMRNYTIKKSNEELSQGGKLSEGDTGRYSDDARWGVVVDMRLHRRSEGMCWAIDDGHLVSTLVWADGRVALLFMNRRQDPSYAHILLKITPSLYFRK